MMNISTKRRIIVIAAAALALTAILPFAAERAVAFLNLVPPIYTQEKSEVALDEDDAVKKGAEKANVLFLIDTGSTMTFSPEGTMPEVPNNATEVAGNVTTPQQAADMLINATYGHGSLPVVGRVNTTSVYSGPDRYGRDIDDTNNMTSVSTNLENHTNNYYSPFDYTGNKVAAQYGLGNVPLPYALVFKNTYKDWWQNGPPQGTGNNAIKNALVPNDSRMYKMKLVMWRILSETVLLENLRIGMATTFQELNKPHNIIVYGADFYKASPYGANSSLTARINGITYNGVNFKHGTGPGWSTGLVNAGGVDLDEAYANAQTCFWGIDREYYLESKNSMKWRLVNRAYLRVPIVEYSDAHISQFRLWIDGFEDVRNTDANAPYFFNNPELIGDGKTFLSTAIYSGHPQLTRQQLFGQRDVKNLPGIVFSSRETDTVASLNERVITPGYYNTEFGVQYLDIKYSDIVQNNFKKGSGEALGTILDFFSPPVSTGAAGMSGVPSPGSAHNVFKAPRSSFPLNDPCEKNWLIIFTAGDDSSEYSSAKAVEDLYKHTKNNALTKLKKEGTGSNNNEFESIRLQDGIRTLVVGFVDPDSNAANVVALRKKLNDMAEAGDPDNPDAKAFFANDVESLIHAMRSVLARINSEIQPAKGSMLEGASFGDESYDGSLDADVLNLYAGSYRINIYDQWQGTLTRYEAVKDQNTGKIKNTKKWEMNSRLTSERDTTPGARNLYFWAGAAHNGSNKGLRKLDYTPPSTFTSASTRTPHPITSTHNVNLVPPIASMDAAMLAASGGQTDWTKRVHPSRALINWYYGWELAYAKNDTQYARRYMVSDSGMSGITKVGRPEIVDSLPGFLSYAQTHQSSREKLYFQTNDGLLHVVDAQGGDEDWAILPPPSLLPYRLFGLKARKSPQNGLYQWINVDGYLVTTSDDIPITSIPSFTLDGPAQVRYFDFGTSDNHDWIPYLVATLGRGGGGIYAMDVSDASLPEFKWYHENYEDDSGKVHLFSQHSGSGADPAETKIDMTPERWLDIYDEPDKHPYEQLGFNNPKPHFAVTRHEAAHSDPDGYYNMIALPGGVQNYLDLTKNGAMGSALYLIDPALMYHNGSGAEGGVRVFNSGSLVDADTKWRAGDSIAGIGIPNPYMGMMVSEPVFLAAESISNNWVADGVFAADNRGNIFLVSFVDPGDNDKPLPRGGWRIRTIASLRKSGDAATDSYSIPAGVVAGARTDKSEIWVGGGTSNVGTRGHSDEFDARIKNKEQMIFCFKLPDLSEPTPGMTYRGGGNGRPGVWTGLDADDADSEMDSDNEDDGWYIPLRPEEPGYNAEYVTTRPVMFGGNLYVATFREKVIDSGDSSLCENGNVQGESRLYTVEMDSGRAGMWDDGNKKYLTFRGLKITGFTTSSTGDSEVLIITYEILSKADADADLKQADDDEDSISRSEGDLDFLSVKMMSKSGTTSPITSNDGVINYWRYYENQDNY
jgi:hypothetical protein